MVYVNSSGQMVQSPGVVKRFKEAWAIFVLFVLSLFSPISQLINPGASSSSGSSGSGFRSSGGSSSSGSGGNRRGGFRTMSDIRPPPMPFGGCSGGSCG